MTVFLGCIKRLARNPVVWIFVLAFPFVICLVVVATSGNTAAAEGPVAISIGVSDLDGSVLSEAMVRRMGEQYECLDVPPGHTGAYLSEQKVTWVLTIPRGFQEELLAGRIPELAGSSISVSDAQHLASSSAQATAKALLILAAGAVETELPRLVSGWEDASRISVRAVDVPASWELSASWMGFYGWISILTAFFMVRTIMEDRRRGLPERIGALPVSRRGYMLQCTLAVVVAGELSAALLMLGVGAALGSAALPNPAHMFLLLSVYNLFAAGLSLALFSLIKSDGSTSMAVIMISTLLAMLGGSYWPVDAMPAPMRSAAKFTPNYWLNRGLNGIENITPEDYWLPVLLVLAFAAGVFLLGSLRRPVKSNGA